MTEEPVPEMVERVARAIFPEAFGEDIKKLKVGTIALAQQDARKLARAAIEAYRTITPEMSAAALATRGAQELNACVSIAFVHGVKITPGKSPLEQMHEAMIDAALGKDRP